MIYLASPYSHPDAVVRQKRFEAACRAAAALLRAGFSVFSPIAHSHPIALHGVPGTWAFWQQVDREQLRRCQAIVVLRLAGWETSVGVHAEIEQARRWGIPVIEVDPAHLEPRPTFRPVVYC
jgi:nucleoside 2-deoxyribosyltransferase